MTENAVLYALSTLAQTCAALAALVGAVGLYRLGILTNRQRDAFDDIHVALRLPLAVLRQQVLGRARAAAVTQQPMQELVDAFDGLGSNLRSSLVWLYLFEAWNLLLIGASLAGFNYVPHLMHAPWMFGALWASALGTIVVTGYCVYAWTRG